MISDNWTHVFSTLSEQKWKTGYECINLSGLQQLEETRSQPCKCLQTCQFCMLGFSGAFFELLLFFSHSVMSDSLWLHGMQHTRPPCPSPSPRACSDWCPLSWWCHPTVLSAVVPFSSCPQAFPASRSFPVCTAMFSVLMLWMISSVSLLKTLVTARTKCQWSPQQLLTFQVQTDCVWVLTGLLCWLCDSGQILGLLSASTLSCKMRILTLNCDPEMVIVYVKYLAQCVA